MKKFLLLIVLFFSVNVYADKVSDYYDAAKQEMQVGKYDAAYKHLQLLISANNNSANYRDVPKMLEECKTQVNLAKKYQDAKQAMKKKQYEGALKQLKTIKKESKSGYQDVDKLIAECEKMLRDKETLAQSGDKRNGKGKSKNKDKSTDMAQTHQVEVTYLDLTYSFIDDDGTAGVYELGVNTNIYNWSISSDSYWCNVNRKSPSMATIEVSRNDHPDSRQAVVTVQGENITQYVKVKQRNRGYAGRYNDYFNTKNGDFKVTWFGIDLHGMTTLGNNVSTMDFRWKPVEVSLINLNLDYFQDGGVSFNWEPIVRGYMPITRDGKWAAYAGVGAHISMIGGSHHFLLELGADVNWTDKYNSRIFFKYNGGVVIGMSFGMGKWFNF